MLSNTMKIMSVTLFVLGLMLFGLMQSNNNPYKSGRTLPKINVEAVTQVTVEYFVDDNHNGCYDGDVDQLVNWFNESKELKTEIGATSDCRMTIFMKDGREIYIWNLYSYEWVTIGYREGESYYQTNVYSEELATYFMDLREENPEEISTYMLLQ